MPSIEETDDSKLPPLWGASYWWTRGGALIGLAALLAGVVMVSLLGQHIGSCGLPKQLTNPTLAIEVAGSWDDVVKMVGPCEAAHCGNSPKDESSCQVAGGCKPICSDKVTALTFEQYEDYGFIVIYWLFLVYLGVVNWKFCYWERFPVFAQVIGKMAGAVTMVAGTLGAQADWRENDHILQALSEVHMVGGPVPLMRFFAYTKWRLVFVAIGAATPVFVFWTGRSNQTDLRQSAFSHLLARMTAVLALSTLWTGFAACRYGDDHRLEVATQRLDLVILATMLTLATAQIWRGGTMVALDRLARLPGLSFLATLFSSEDDSAK